MNFKRGYVFLGLLSIGIGGCKSPKSTTGVARKRLLSDKEQSEVTYNFYNANREKLLGNNEIAAGLFAECLKKDPQNDASMYEIAQIFAQQGKNNEALFYIKKASSIDPKNVWYQSFYGELLEKNKQYLAAVDVFEHLSKSNPDQPEYYYGWASALLYANKPAEAIKVYDKLEEKIGVNADLISQKEKLYLKIGKIDKAAAEVEKLITAYPKETQYYMLLADLYQANGMSEKAMDIYKKILEVDPENGFVHLSLADYYRTKGDKDKSFNELKTVFANKNIDIDTKLKILASYYGIVEQHPEMAKQALTLNKLLIETNPNDVSSHAFYAEFLYQSKDYTQARDEYRKALAIDKQNYSTWQELLRVELDLKDYNAMVSESDDALILFPNQPAVYYLNGIAKIQAKKYKEAIDILNQGVKLVVDNTPLEADFYANIGDAYNKLKESKLSDAAYNKSITLDPKNASTLNNYSYYLSLRSDSLAKAEALSRLSNEIDVDNSYYQDTYGWILYKQGKYAEAKDWIEKAMKNRNGDSAVIMEHYGDVLYKLGDVNKAVEYWEKARKAGASSEVLNKKILDRKLYE
jgi:tetratricopeptide (TPR) repeat protein